MAAEHDVGGNNTQAVPVLRPCLGSGSSSDGSQEAPLAGMNLVFKAGGSDSGSEAKAAGSSVRGPKFAGAMLQRTRKALLRGSDARLGAGSAPKRPNLPTPLPIRPEANVPGAVPAVPPEGAKVRSKFSEVIKDNRIVGNGLKLQQYDFMENDDDVILDESDEIPFVETWGYCLIGCFTGPFSGRQTLNSLVKSWNGKCHIIPYAKGWTVFRIPVVNPEPAIPPRVTRSKARAKARDAAPPKESFPKESVNVSTVNGSLPEADGSEDMVISPSKNGKGLKGVGKGKTIISQIPVVSPNSFDALNVIGGTSGTHDADVANVQMGDLVPSSSRNANQDNDEGVWQHVTRKGNSNGHGGVVSSSVLHADNVIECTGALWTFKPLSYPAYC
ncbi:hypothetical protein LIER_29407 [Lithospermum erythrorhizon]|uniref:Uncharacterized protein n=1 Tax=Lithospermum erythrorhizon TaxID=34254 RepID=A0AAV3RME8_LITER